MRGLWLVFLLLATSVCAFTDPVLIDDFNRASTGPPPSASWTEDIISTDAGGLRVNTNTVLQHNGAGGTGSAWWNVANFGPDVAVSLDGPDMTAATGQSLELWVRIQSPGVAASTDGYACRFYSDDNRIRLLRFTDSATPTDLTTETTAFNPGDGNRFGIEAVGSTIRCWIDQGAGWVQALTATDGTYGTAGRVGVRITSGLLVFDNFRVETLASTSFLSLMRRRTW